MEDRRRAPRAESRMLCRLRSGIRSHSGMVLDASAGGVFVQTTASLPPGTPLSLTIHVPRGKFFTLKGQVARVVVAAAGLKPGAGSGLGVVLSEPPKEYVDWVKSLSDRPKEPLRVSGGKPTKGKNAPGKTRAFQVKLQEIASKRTRDVLVRCGSEAEASELALAEFDDDWKVLRVEAD